MLIYKDRKFIQAPFQSEQEIEDVAIENAEYIFGPSAIYLPKKLFRTSDGFATITDGFVIDPSARQWFIVEVELSRHSVWSHIAPQVAKQITAASQPASKKALIKVALNRIKSDEILLEKFTEIGIPEIEIHTILAEILEKKPIVGMPIDAISRDLQEWATTLRNEVKLWVVKKYVEFGDSDNIMFEIPEEYRPVLDTQEETETAAGVARYDVTVFNLITAELLHDGSKLTMIYGGRSSAEKKLYEGLICSDGTIEVLGKSFSSPSYAALYVIQSAGSKRRTVNGWTAWRCSDGKTLAEVRDVYLAIPERQNS
jgi:hypothetical protein